MFWVQGTDMLTLLFSILYNNRYNSDLRVNGVMSTSVEEKIVISWEEARGADGYFLYEKKEEEASYRCLDMVTSSPYIRKNPEHGKRYQYYVRAYKKGKRKGKKSRITSVMVPEKGISTIKNLLQIALAPVGSTMYVWGGGWNHADTAAGAGALRIGLAKGWREFATGKCQDYDYQKYRYQIDKGLDCSGYIGWCIYNLLHTADYEPQKDKAWYKLRETEEVKENIGKQRISAGKVQPAYGYVYASSIQAKKLAELGFGGYKEAVEVSDYQPGDIMSATCGCCQHVWMVVGQCEDGSVVLLHSSPTGVQLSGTVMEGASCRRDEKKYPCSSLFVHRRKKSRAYYLAQYYMKTYYKKWYYRYPVVEKDIRYLKHYSQMRFADADTQPIGLSDPEGYRHMSPEEILKDLFGRPA